MLPRVYKMCQQLKADLILRRPYQTTYCFSTQCHFVICTVHFVLESKSSRWARFVATMGETRSVFGISVGKRLRTRPLGWTRSRW